MSVAERYLAAMLLVFSLPWLVWRLGRTEYWAPLVVVQIVAGILLGPGVLGTAWPAAYSTIFTPDVILMLNGVASWAVMLFVFIAGVELDLGQAWQHRRESGITAGLALGMPFLAGCGAAWVMLGLSSGWMGAKGETWQFVAGVGMACAVTALPILILFMEKLEILRQPLGQRILRYASVDDLAIWGVLALVLMDWARVRRPVAFLLAFALLAAGLRRVLPRLAERDRWPLVLVWLLACALGADWCGLHFMVGAFLAGSTVESRWLDQDQMDRMRHQVLMLLMPVFFLSTGLRTQWNVGGAAVFVAAAWMLAASVLGKLAGVHLAGRVLGWPRGESGLIGWLLQTKALIMIIFANVLLDKQVIRPDTFTALLLMAVASTMLTVPMVSRRLSAQRAR